MKNELPPYEPKPGFRFVIINISVTNQGFEEGVFPDFYLKENGNRREHEISPTLDIDDVLLSDMANDGETIEGPLVFQVPEGTTEYQLELDTLPEDPYRGKIEYKPPTQTLEPAPTPTPTEAPTQEELESDIEASLKSFEVDITKVESVGDLLIIEYRTTETTQEGIAREIGYVNGAYTTAIKQGMDTERADVGVFDINGEEIGTYWIDTDWAKQYNKGEITAEEFSLKVMDTLQTVQ